MNFHIYFFHFIIEKLMLIPLYNFPFLFIHGYIFMIAGSLLFLVIVFVVEGFISYETIKLF